MEDTQETDPALLIVDINNMTINDPVVNGSTTENDSEPSSSVQPNVYEHLFEQLKENNKHIFVLSTAGKPIYTR